MPTRIVVSDVVEIDIVELDPERKLLTNFVKMVAYQAESDRAHLVTPNYKRAADEGRTLIQSALAAPADLEVAGNELRVLLTPLGSPHRTRAIAALCHGLNRRPSIFSRAHVYASNVQLLPEKRPPGQERKGSAA